MRHVDEYRRPDACRELVDRIRSRATRRWTVMEVCGGQTHGLLRHGLDEELRDEVELLHGPGCPVCVTPVAAVDAAVALALRDDVVLASFGDMLRVPGSAESLLAARGRGARVRLVYSPSDAVELAAADRTRHVVFLAVGFETTAPATALAVLHAARRGLDNFALLAAHVRVVPAMEAIVADGRCGVQGFLAAGHVCTVTGLAEYGPFVRRRGVPVVATGFEPVDLLLGLDACLTQLEQGRAEVENAYGRSVTDHGNVGAQRLIETVYETCDREWRGFGTIAAGGLRLREEFARFDAERRFPEMFRPGPEQCGACASSAAPECRSGEVLAGRIKPIECGAFGARCTPETPLGAPMVSSEGACAAYFRYARRAEEGSAVRAGSDAR